MAAQVRVLRQRVKSVRSTQKITKAQEMIATSRIAKAQAKVAAAAPYSRGITDVLTALASASTLDHPLLNEREEPKRAGILLITADRGLCGGYNSAAIKAAEELGALLRSQGKESVMFVIGPGPGGLPVLLSLLSSEPPEPPTPTTSDGSASCRSSTAQPEPTSAGPSASVIPAIFTAFERCFVNRMRRRPI